MPALSDLFLDPVSLGVFALYAALFTWEWLRPARVLSPVPGWHGKGIAFFLLYFLLSSYLPYAWSDALAELRLVDLSALGTVGGVIVGTLVYEGLVYAWHRAMHGSDLLFRTFHQLHHSAERIDVAGAFFMSPLDIAGWTFVFSLALSLVGLSPGAIAGTVLLTTFLSVFQHANVRTPRWLGYLVQRPESHSHHHARGVHRDNYSDLPVFDLLFGTFHNPEDFAPEAGYWPGASERTVDMLLLRDVSTPAREVVAPTAEHDLRA